MAMTKTVSINIVDTGDNHPIHYKVSNEITEGPTAGFRLVELLDQTFDKEFSFRYDMLDQFISALQEIKRVIQETK